MNNKLLDRVALSFFVIIIVTAITSITYFTSKENSESKYCSMNNGTYYNGLCFRNDILVRIK